MNSTYGEYIKSKRESVGLSLREMANKIGVSPSYLSDIEKNKRNAPPKDKLNKIIKVLGIDSKEKGYYYDLAGKSRSETPVDISEIIKNNINIKFLLRKIEEENLDVMSLIELIEET